VVGIEHGDFDRFVADSKRFRYVVIHDVLSEPTPTTSAQVNRAKDALTAKLTNGSTLTSGRFAFPFLISSTVLNLALGCKAFQYFLLGVSMWPLRCSTLCVAASNRSSISLEAAEHRMVPLNSEAVLNPSRWSVWMWERR
jgi:hypothetical protein